ncbi:thermonuclease family protein [Sphingobacterium deserti]|nr:thermonuclease family protein [Sphingobacterium deserti]
MDNRMAFSNNKIVNEKVTSAESYKIVKVSDGDTFWCEDTAGERIKVRLIGIDAPEPRNYFKKKKQPFGKEASAYATKLLLNKSVKLEMDLNPLDQYGRTLAYAYLSDGTFINEKIVKDGYAVLMTIQPNVKHVERLVAAQRYAKERQLGLWNKTNN